MSDSEIQQMLDEIELMAVNDGDFYPSLPDLAVSTAFEEWYRRRNREALETFKDHAKELVQKVQESWEEE